MGSSKDQMILNETSFFIWWGVEARDLVVCIVDEGPDKVLGIDCKLKQQQTYNDSCDL